MATLSMPQMLFGLLVMVLYSTPDVVSELSLQELCPIMSETSSLPDPSTILDSRHTCCLSPRVWML